MSYPIKVWNGSNWEEIGLSGGALSITPPPNISTSGSVGSSSVLARSDHTHGFDANALGVLQSVAASAYVQKSLVNAKGDLITATANDTPAIQSVGANGEVLYADSSATNGLRWQPNYNAGRNRIINGSFDVWQRGTSFSANQAYTADRWNVGWDSTPTVTISRQAFTAGTAPVAGLEGTYFFRTAVTSAASMSLLDVKQYIEDVRTFAGQTVTVSFYAKADATRTLSTLMVQNFGSGGSGDVATSAGSVTLTTSWARYSLTVAVPSISGKTLGAGNFVGLYLRHPGSTFTIDLWGVQVEAGSVATRFEEEPYEATLRKCQRYYYRMEPGAAGRPFGVGQAYGTATSITYVKFPVNMRSRPTAVEQSGTASHYKVTNSTFGDVACSAVPSYNDATVEGAEVAATVSSGLTAGNASFLKTNNTAGYLAWSAEL